MSISAETHPSYFTLDRLSLGIAATEAQAHVAACAECRGYVESLRAPAPEEQLELVRQRIAQQPRVLHKTRWAWLGGASLAAAAVFALLIGLRPQPELPRSGPVYIGEKGFSSVWIYVRHGASTALWDGKKPVSVGDRLRLKVDPARFRRVEVYSTKDASAPELLYEANVTPGQSVTLPDAWEVDGEPGAERLLVVFSNEPVKPVWPDWLQGKAPPTVLLLPFVLPKSGSTP